MSLRGLGGTLCVSQGARRYVVCLGGGLGGVLCVSGG